MKKSLFLVWALWPLAAAAQTSRPAPITVSIHSPSAGSFVAGNVTLSASASSGVGVTGIQLKIDGADIGITGAVSPYVMTWNSAQIPDGLHVMTALAWDVSGASASTTVDINVQNLPTMISSVVAGTRGSTNAAVAWFTGQNSDTQADFGPTPWYGASSILDSTMVSTHTVTLFGLTPGTLYHYRVKSRNAAGVQAVSGDFTFTTSTSLISAATVIGDAAAAKAPRRFLTPTNIDAIFGPSAREVTILDLKGRKVFHAAGGGAGAPIVWHATNVESGVYIAKIRDSNSVTIYQSFAVVK